jgi:hypothetical protein
MTTTVLSPLLIQHFVDNSGNPLVNGQLFTYAAGTTTPQATYTDSTGATQNSNPVILNSRGEASIWIPPNTAYKFVLEDQSGNVIWSQDQVTVAQSLTLYGGVDTGTANNYVVTYSSPFTAYTSGTVLWFIPSNTNTSSNCTINVNNLGPITVANLGGGSGSVYTGQLVAGNPVSLIILSGVAYVVEPLQATGSFTLTGTGFSGTAPTMTVYYRIQDSQVTIAFTGLSGTSNMTSFTLTGWPSGLQGNSQQGISPLLYGQDSGTPCGANLTIQPVTGGTTVIVNKLASGGAWTASGTKGLQGGCFSYLLN